MYGYIVYSIYCNFHRHIYATKSVYMYCLCGSHSQPGFPVCRLQKRRPRLLHRDVSRIRAVNTVPEMAARLWPPSPSLSLLSQSAGPRCCKLLGGSDSGASRSALQWVPATLVDFFLARVSLAVQERAAWKPILVWRTFGFSNQASV